MQTGGGLREQLRSGWVQEYTGAITKEELLDFYRRTFRRQPKGNLTSINLCMITVI
jgi:hypothetical protein